MRLGLFVYCIFALPHFLSGGIIIIQMGFENPHCDCSSFPNVAMQIIPF